MTVVSLPLTTKPTFHNHELQNYLSYHYIVPNTLH